MLSETILDKTFFPANRSCLKEFIAYHNVKEYVNSRVVKVLDNSVVINRNGHEETIEADTVITSIGYI